ncbi:hypothetical protein LIER_35098 [Lithospermum erythrorhizon]|uniref:Uncharacterized protein n=1 Tax=Lithospermum erythrorhizon TaxID=34254 RepID=A0AAV3NP03_LITER
MKGTKPGGIREGRIKRSLRKQGVTIRHVKRESPVVSPSLKEAVVDSLVKDQGDDDVMVVSYTTSKNRRSTRASVATLKKKRATLDVRGVDVEADEPADVVDVEKLEKLVKKRKVAKKGKGNAKRPSVDQVGGFVPKKKKGL